MLMNTKETKARDEIGAAQPECQATAEQSWNSHLLSSNELILASCAWSSEYVGSSAGTVTTGHMLI